MRLLHSRRRIVGAASVLIIAVAVGTVQLLIILTQRHTDTESPAQVTTVSPSADTIKGDSTRYETTKPSLDDYKVAADAPRALYIAKLNIAARIMPMGVTADNSVEAPLNIYDSGWYTGSSKPGKSGAMFIDGHASGQTRQGLFGYLDTLKAGDEVIVEKGDGARLTYVVRAAETVPKDAVNMAKALSPITPGANGLNLMTCTGSWVADEETYDERVIVYTEQVS